MHEHMYTCTYLVHFGHKEVHICTYVNVIIYTTTHTYKAKFNDKHISYKLMNFDVPGRPSGLLRVVLLR